MNVTVAEWFLLGWAMVATAWSIYQQHLVRKAEFMVEVVAVGMSDLADGIAEIYRTPDGKIGIKSKEGE